jgi:hypothetical protein
MNYNEMKTMSEETCCIPQREPRLSEKIESILAMTVEIRDMSDAIAIKIARPENPNPICGSNEKEGFPPSAMRAADEIGRRLNVIMNSLSHTLQNL